MPRISIGKRILVVLAGYLLVGAFFVMLVTLQVLKVGFSETEKLIVSAIFVAPLLVGLLWESIRGVKLGEIEITLNEVTPRMDFELAATIQELQGSGTPALVEAIRAAVQRSDLKLLAINLRSSPYWWSTRLYLVAALAHEYTLIDRIVFLENDAARLFLGMASPVALRTKLGQRFPELERVFRNLQQIAGIGIFGSEQIVNIGTGWSMQLFGQPPVSEASFRELVTAAKLREWLGDSLETESRKWNGASASRSLYSRILNCNGPYVALVHRQRLEKVVNRSELASKIASSVLS
jgi:hypothetical protein